MTLTRKFGALLLLLTAGPLIGITAFAFFFAGTAQDGVYLLASQLEMTRLQQLQVQTFMIRDGQNDIRPVQLRTIESVDALIKAMEHGGQKPERSLVLLSTVLTIENSNEGIERAISTIQQGLPKPPPDLQGRIVTVAKLWTYIKPRLRTICEKPNDDPQVQAAYDGLQAKMAEMVDASRLIVLRVGSRLITARERMLLILGGTSAVAVILFGLGLWSTKRYISRPIELAEKVAQKIRAGDFSQRVAVVSDDEVGSLAIAMNEMCAEVEKSVEKYRDLFENASDIIYTMSLDGRFLSINRAGERITGYSRAEFLNMSVDQITTPDQLDISNQMMKRKLSGEQGITIYPLQIISKDGRQVSLEVGTRLIYEDGKPIAVQGMARDITERRRLEEQLWIAQKMEAVGRLAGGIAHEFGNVLTIISGYCVLMLRGLKKDDPLRTEIDGIQKAAQRANSLIRHLLGFSKGQMFRPKVLDIRETLDHIGGMLSRLIGEDIQLQIVCDAGTGSVRADPSQFEQVMVNLALNARDAMPGGGTLRVEAANTDVSQNTKNTPEDLPEGSYVRMRISDTGCGMSEAVMSRIFEPFFTTKERGTGLGLSTVYGIVRQWGGSIVAESQVGRGTVFTIYLPRQTKPTELPRQESAVTTPLSGTESILVVEDNEDARMLIREMLRANGYDVIEAVDQQQAISICSSENPKIDLMLTDVIMPKMSGPELVAQVRPLRPDMKILYMSGYTQDKFERYVQKGEPIEFIQKPLLPDVLAAKIREVLDSSRDQILKDETNEGTSR